VLGQWAREVEQAGYDELFIPEHVVGVNANQRPDWRPLNPNTLEKDKPIYDHSWPRTPQRDVLRAFPTS